MKFGIADYGILVWEGGFYDYEERVLMVKRLGYDGLERIYPTSPENAIEKAYSVAKSINFANAYYRNDIGQKALAAKEEK